MYLWRLVRCVTHYKCIWRDTWTDLEVEEKETRKLNNTQRILKSFTDGY